MRRHHANHGSPDFLYSGYGLRFALSEVEVSAFMVCPPPAIEGWCARYGAVGLLKSWVVPVAAFEPSGIHHGGQVSLAQVVGPEVGQARQVGTGCCRGGLGTAGQLDHGPAERCSTGAHQPLDGGLYIRRGIPLDLA